MTPQELAQLKELAKKCQQTGETYNLDILDTSERAEIVWLMVKEIFRKYNNL